MPGNEEKVAENNIEEPQVDSSKEDNSEKIIWGQKRVPNIKRGYNPNYPFYMMGFLVLILVLSFVLAKLTS